MSDVDDTLESLQAADNVLGCAIVTRDGLPGQVRFNRAHDPESLSAMSAAALAAAETAVLGLEPKGVDQVLIDGSATKTLIQGISDQHILVIVGSDRLSHEDLLKLAQEAQRGLKVLHAS